MMLNKEKQNLLVFGFTRQRSTTTLPIDIINLMISFFTTAVIWVIKNDEFKHLIPATWQARKKSACQDAILNMIHKSRLIGPSFFIQKMEFQIRFEHSISSHVSLEVFLITHPDDVIEIGFVSILRCDETNTDFRDYHILRRSDMDGTVARGWRSDTLLFSEVTKHKQLTLSADIDLLYIKYINKKEPFVKPIQLNAVDEIIKFEWRIDNDILDSFKTCPGGTPFFPLEDFGVSDNFCIWCAPNGVNDSDRGNCVLFLEILRLPFPRSEIQMKYVMEMKSEKDNISAKYEYNGTVHGFAFWPDGTVQTSELQNMTEIVFSITIQILSL